MNVIDYDPWPVTTTVSNAATTTTTVLWHKPEGRGRRYDRLRRGLARRLRIPFVRRILQDVAEGRHPETSYGHMWLSTNALADTSFACTCHKRERYDRRKGR